MRNRLLIVLCACFLVSSAAWADDMGYVACSAYPQGAQVLPHAGKSSEVVADVPCGERFTILQSGLYFTQVKTKDGKVGFVYSYLVSRDKPASSAAPASAAAPAPASSLPSPHGTFLPPKPVASASVLPAPSQSAAAPPQPSAAPAQAPAPVATSRVVAPVAAVAESKPAAQVTPPPPAVQPAPSPAPAAASNVSPSSAPPAESKPMAPVSPSPAPVQPAPTPTPAPATPAPAAASSAAAPAPTVVEIQPPAPASHPEATAQPPVFHPKPKNTGPVFEPPFPRVRTEPLIEIYGGYAYARLVNGGTSTNVIDGVLGSFGWNFKPWLQLVGDSSYSTVTVSGTKTVLYGNHFGPRIFLRRAQSGWGMSPFVEALFGGSRADTTTGGVKTSNQAFSIKAGGGLDMHPSWHIEIRVINVDYYRTSFPGTSSQNNYWASAGVVFRFLGGRPH